MDTPIAASVAEIVRAERAWESTIEALRVAQTAERDAFLRVVAARAKGRQAFGEKIAELDEAIR